MLTTKFNQAGHYAYLLTDLLRDFRNATQKNPATLKQVSHWHGVHLSKLFSNAYQEAT